MYNMLKNKMSSMVFHNFKKNSYKLISKVKGKEEIYLQDNKMVILVEDEDTGNKLYELVKTLKKQGEKISSEHVEIKITNYVATKYDTVQIIFADVTLNFENNWDQYSDLDKLQEMVSFVYAMQEKGYYFEESDFDNGSCTNISNFLSFFKPNSSETEVSNGCIIKYIHYVLSSGGNLDEYYKPIVTENRICAVSDFPYCMPIIKMCYNYYVSKIIPTNIVPIIREERREQYYGKNLKLYKNYLIVARPDFSWDLRVLENTDEYTVYEGYIKIYKHVSRSFEDFLEDDDNFIRKSRDYGYVAEKLSNTIIDYNGRIIGYKYNTDCIQHNTKFNVLEYNFESQVQIICTISRLKEFIEDVRSKSVYPYTTGKDEFDLEKDLNWFSDGISFNVIDISKLYNLVTSDPEAISEKVTYLFFKLLNIYLEKQYGKFTDNLQILEKKEVRYLPPIIAKQFIKFALGEKVELSLAAEEFYKFLNSGIEDAGNGVAYNPIFKNNSAEERTFSFMYELEDKYGVVFESNSRIELPDNRTLITFQRRKDFFKIEEKINSIKKKIKDKISLNPEYIKLIEISEIVYAPVLNSKNMYPVVGYIAPEVKGEKITKDMILGFNNREMLRFAGKLISNFGRYYINCDSIFVNIISNNDNTNRDFEFFVNILDEKFSIEKSGVVSEIGTVNSFLEYLKSRGYNKNAFTGIYPLPSSDILQQYLLSYADSADAYCKKHKIYYNSEEFLCPVCKESCVVIKSDNLKTLDKVMEDDYAVHYFCGEYNVKIYKSNLLDIKAVEKNIDIMLERLKQENAISVYMQECFIPYKKVLNEKREFIGYIYRRVNFNGENFIDFAEVEKLENLPRIKCLLRLISQIISLTEKKYCFLNNPFTHVFLDREYQKQVQILNIDLLTTKPSKLLRSKETRNWTCEYVDKIIRLDANIDIKYQYTGNLYKLQSSIENASKDMTMHCPIHKFFYSNKYIFCPKCVNPEKMGRVDIEYVDLDDIQNLKEFNKGGESIIYEYRHGELAKVFREQINLDFKKKILAVIFSKKEILEKINQEYHKFKYIIPQRILIDKKTGRIIGYIMKEKVKGYPIASLSAKDFVEEHNLNRQDILEILIAAAEGIETLHDKTNIYIGDLNGGNILFDNQRNVYFLDFDGMGFENIRPLFFTDEYIDPVVRESNSVTKNDDWYSLAVQTFHYLTYSHPFEGTCKKDDNLDTVERMRLRKSLLGNHGIEPPVITENWTWMSKEFKNVLYNIFENELRVSFVNILKRQYNSLYGEKYQIGEKTVEETPEEEGDITSNEEIQTSTDVEEIIQLNSKFIAKTSNPFNCNVERIINQYSAICKENNNYYLIINKNGKQYKVSLDYIQIIDTMILETLEIVVTVNNDIVVAYDMQNSRELFYEVFNYNSDFVTVNGNTLYIAKRHGKENIILQIEFNSNQGIRTNKIRFLTDYDTKGFLAKFNSKYMLVKRNTNGTDEIYCNSEKLCDIDSDFRDSKYNILYDDVTKLWLIVNSKCNYISIQSYNGHYQKVNIPIDINNINLKNASFDKGVLYIPSQNCVYIVNVKSGMAKRMECDKIITPDSRLYNFNSNGFSAITDKKVYEIAKI